MGTSLIIHRRRKMFARKHGTNRLNRLSHPYPQLRGTFHLSTFSRTVVINGSTRHRLSRHFFQTHGLSTELQVVMLVFPMRTMLVFDWIRCLPMKLHHIGFPNQPQGLGPQRQRPFNPYPGLFF